MQRVNNMSEEDLRWFFLLTGYLIILENKQEKDQNVPEIRLENLLKLLMDRELYDALLVFCTTKGVKEKNLRRKIYFITIIRNKREANDQIPEDLNQQPGASFDLTVKTIFKQTLEPTLHESSVDKFIENSNFMNVNFVFNPFSQFIYELKLFLNIQGAQGNQSIEDNITMQTNTIDYFLDQYDMMEHLEMIYQWFRDSSTISFNKQNLLEELRAICGKICDQLANSQAISYVPLPNENPLQFKVPEAIDESSLFNVKCFSPSYKLPLCNIL